MMWDGDPPNHLKATLQNQVSRIRTAYGEEVVLTTPDGYRLGVPTDAEMLRDRSAEAEQLLIDGAASQAYERADEAIGLWAGEPFPDLEHVHGLDAVRRALGASYRSAQNTRVAAALDMGRHGWALHEAERLVGATPLDERRLAMRARALAVAGQRGDALAALAAARRLLRQEMGIDAGPLLDAVEEGILHPGESVTRSVPSRPFVGRQSEVRAVLAGVARRRVVQLGGEPGIGVTRLLKEVRSQLRLLGVSPVYVAALEHQDSAVSLLQTVLSELGLEPGPRGVVAAFSDVIGTAAAEAGPLAILVDDVELVGPTAYGVLRQAAAHERVVLILGGHTPGAVPTSDPEDPGPEQVWLTGLNRDAVAQIALEGAATARSVDVDSLLRDSGGNPSLLEALLDSPDSAHVGQAHAGALVADFLGSLDDRERALVERAAVAGDEFPWPILDGTGGPPPGLIDLGPGQTLHFRHGAVREAVYQGVAPARREELHVELGRAARQAGASASLVARHLVAAGPLAGTEAVTACQEAASSASRQGAHADAARWLRTALDVEGVGERDRQLLTIELGDAQRLAGDPSHAATLIDAVERALRQGDEQLVSQGCFALLQLGATTTSGTPYDGLEDLLERSLAMLGTPSLRAPVCGAASLAWSLSDDAARSRAYFEEADAAAERPEDRARVLPFAYMALGMPGDLERRRACALELSRIGDALDDPTARFEAAQLDFSVRLQDADGAGVRAAVARMGELVDRVGDVGRRWAYQFALAAMAHLDGHDESSERLSAESFALFATVSESRAMAAQSGQLFGLRLTQGRLAELAEVLAWLVENQPGLPAWHAAYALSAAHAGADRATVVHHAELTLDLAQQDSTWLAAHVVGARAAAACEDRSLAGRYIERLEPWTRRGVWQGTCSYGPVDTALALACRVLGDQVATRRHAGRARSVADRLQAQPFHDELDRLGLD